LALAPSRIRRLFFESGDGCFFAAIGHSTAQLQKPEWSSRQTIHNRHKPNFRRRLIPSKPPKTEQKNRKMKPSLHLGLSLLTVAATIFAALSAPAQQITGTPGSPSATTTISGNQLPAPDPKFGGVIKDNALQSKAWWAPRIVPPKQAPNILLIMTDDSGFAVPSTYGGVIPTPSMDRIAKNGLRYTQIYSTALCSPTRAALITGRNHHSAGFGVARRRADR
jgi:hypothetical protein